MKKIDKKNKFLQRNKIQGRKNFSSNERDINNKVVFIRSSGFTFRVTNMFIQQ